MSTFFLSQELHWTEICSGWTARCCGPDVAQVPSVARERPKTRDPLWKSPASPAACPTRWRRPVASDRTCDLCPMMWQEPTTKHRNFQINTVTYLFYPCIIAVFYEHSKKPKAPYFRSDSDVHLWLDLPNIHARIFWAFDPCRRCTTNTIVGGLHRYRHGC